MSIYIGTCGYSFGDWQEALYPPGLSAGERLSYYGDRFSAVELVHCFYGVPSAASLRRMLESTPATFRFTAKAHQSISHGEGTPEFAATRDAFGVMLEAGRLAALLIQLPPSFHCTREAVRTLRRVREELVDFPLAVEFRHASWARPGTLEFLREQRMAYCAVDEPALPGLMPPDAHVTAEFGYVRLHGRNAANWHSGSTEARHDYTYSEAELEEWAVRIEAMAIEARDVYVMFNNCVRGQALPNAVWLSRRLGLPIPDVTPPQTSLALS